MIPAPLDSTHKDIPMQPNDVNKISYYVLTSARDRPIVETGVKKLLEASL